MENNHHPRGRELTFIAALFVLYFLVFIGSHPLISPDETRYTNIAWNMFKWGDYITPELAGAPFLGKPPLFYWWDVIAYHVFGVNDFASRFFPGLIGAFTCIMAYIFGCIVYNRRTGLLMAFLLGTAPLYFALTHYANMDGEVASWISCSLFAFLIGVHKQSRQEADGKWFYLAYFFAALAFMTKGLMALVLPGMIVFVWVLLRNDWRLLLRIRLFSGLLLFVLLITPWLLLAEYDNPGFLYYFFIYNQFYRFVGENFNNPHSFFYFWPIVIAGIFPLTLYLIQGFGHHLKNFASGLNHYRIDLFLVLWLVLVTLFFSIPEGKPLGHIAPALPPASLIMAVYFARLWQQPPTPANRIASWAVAILFILMAIALLTLPIYVHNPHVVNAMPYACIGAAFLLAGAATLIVFLQQQRPLAWLISTIIVIMMLFLVNLLASLKTWDLQYNWPIAREAKTYLKRHPDAEVMMMGLYYYAMPLYLDRKVPIVANWKTLNFHQLRDGWKRQIYEGIYHSQKPGLPETFVTYKALKQRWQQAEPGNILVISSVKPGKAFSKRVGDDHYKVIGHIPRRYAYLIVKTDQEHPYRY